MGYNFLAKQNELTVVADIGSTKVVVLAGYFNDYNKIEVAGFAKVNTSDGVIRGVVKNIDKTVEALNTAILKVEKQIGKKIHKVQVAIGSNIKSRPHSDGVYIDEINNEICAKDIDKLTKKVYQLVLPPGEKIMDIIPLEYIVDSSDEVKDPVGMSGHHLVGNFHVVTGKEQDTQSMVRCIQKLGLKVEKLVLKHVSTAYSVLSDQEKRGGVAMVDIGGGTTEVSIFKGGMLRHCNVLPLGSNLVTRDLEFGCQVMSEIAEKIKIKYGSALASEIKGKRIISIPGYRKDERTEIEEVNVARIIEARMVEILDYINWEIKKSGFENRLIAGIVLTGGGSMLKNLDDLTELQTGMKVRKALPIEHLAQGYREELAHPAYSAIIGLMRNALIENQELKEKLNRNRHEVASETLVASPQFSARENSVQNHEVVYSNINNSVQDADNFQENQTNKAMDKVVGYLRNFFTAPIEDIEV